MAIYVKSVWMFTKLALSLSKMVRFSIQNRRLKAQNKPYQFTKAWGCAYESRWYICFSLFTEILQQSLTLERNLLQISIRSQGTSGVWNLRPLLFRFKTMVANIRDTEFKVITKVRNKPEITLIFKTIGVCFVWWQISLPCNPPGITLRIHMVTAGFLPITGRSLAEFSWYAQMESLFFSPVFLDSLDFVIPLKMFTFL